MRKIQRRAKEAAREEKGFTQRSTGKNTDADGEILGRGSGREFEPGGSEEQEGDHQEAGGCSEEMGERYDRQSGEPQGDDEGEAFENYAAFFGKGQRNYSDDQTLKRESDTEAPEQVHHAARGAHEIKLIVGHEMNQLGFRFVGGIEGFEQGNGGDGGEEKEENSPDLEEAAAPFVRHGNSLYHSENWWRLRKLRRRSGRGIYSGKLGA